MIPCLAPLALVVLGAATVSPSTLPARGAREAIVTLDTAGMVHLSATSPSGTSCEVVDHQRGPFASAGVSGKTNCELDLLLDAGVYKVRLDSPLKAKGNVTLKLTPFAEQNAPLQKLEEGRVIERPLHPGQQASYWLHVPRRQGVTLRAAGRTVGALRLWRGGEWLEELQTNDLASNASGQQRHEWWMTQLLEPGDYLVVAYGTSPFAWASGKEDDTLQLAWGFEPLPQARTVSRTLGPTGLDTFLLPGGDGVAFLSLQAARATATTLSAVTVSNEGLVSVQGGGESCRIEPKALMPQCVAHHAGNTGQHGVALVRGVPGTTYSLSWAPWVGGGFLGNGDYGDARPTLPFSSKAEGEFLLSVHELPVDRDAPPLSCVLELKRKDGVEQVAGDLLAISPEKPFDRAFNYNGEDESIWFRVTTGGQYRLTTAGDRKSRCDLFRMDPASRQRLVSSPENAKACSLTQTLTPGAYELKLYGGIEGVEKLRIAAVGKTGGTSAVKSSCLMTRQYLAANLEYGLSLNRRGNATARGLQLRALPLTLDATLPLVLEPQSTLELPVAAGRPIEIRGAGSFSCALGGVEVAAKDGVCTAPESSAAATLVLKSRAPESLALALYRPPPPPDPLAALEPFTPVPAPLERLAEGVTTFHSFDRDQSHSLLFEVKEAGLYHVTTEGLLSTECRIRTPVFPSLAVNASGGRGRNCLVANVLNPGRYLVTVKTTGQSRGRAGIRLTRRPVTVAGALAGESELFFRAREGDLVRHVITIPAAGTWQLESSAQGATTSCRLDDRQGWPVASVPMSCSVTRSFAAGEYLWTAMPLTVDSMRRARLEQVKEPLVLQGDQPHEIAFNTWYAARLGKDGKDEFRFELPAPLDLQINLTGGMQGRLYLQDAAGALKPVEIIPPEVSADAAPPPAPVEEEAAPEPEPEPEPAMEASSTEGGEGEGEAAAIPPPPPPPQVRRAALPAAGGKKVHLEAGRYVLLAEHSHADVAISYRLFCGSDTLIPGMNRELPVPSQVTLRMPRTGTLRLKTRGETDVRCRLFDARGKLVLENADHGDDWNCALAEPLAAGDYQLVLESETQRPGTTRVQLSMPSVDDAGVLASGQTLAVGANAITALLPQGADEGTVQEIVLRSTTPFSCAIEDASGALVYRSNERLDCSALLRAGAERHRVRLWTLERPSRIEVTTAARPIDTFSFGKIGAGKAGRATVERAGRYVTGPGVYCLPDGERGLLRPCGPEISLEAGPHVFSALGARTTALVPLDERIARADDARVEPRLLSHEVQIQRQASSVRALHLLSVKSPFGERVPPACSLTPGTRAGLDSACFAASALTRESTARLWAQGEKPIEATVLRTVIALPSSVTPLVPGEQGLSFGAGPLRLAMPATAARVDLTLPPESWAVQLDGEGNAIDLCAPSSDLTRCILSGSGGEIVVKASEPRAMATVLLIDAPAKTVRLLELHELFAAGQGSLRYEIPASQDERILEVSGAARCVTSLRDGTRLHGCRVTLPKDKLAEVAVVHDRGPLRATVALPGQEEATRFGALKAGTPGPFALAQAVKLEAGVNEKAFTLEKDAVVHLHADAGVCGLFAGDKLLEAGGVDAGCDLHRLLRAGSYRFVVRPFGGVALGGTESYTAQKVESLAEGVAPEGWIAPDQVRLFRFETASKGSVGLGLQQPAETLSCTVLDEGQRPLGEGCQQLLSLEKGSYLLAVKSPRSARPMRFRPVLVGLAGGKMDVPDEYLREFFSRIAESK